MMSEMSDLRPRLLPAKRLEVLRQELPKSTDRETIAQLCGVTTRTLRRDLQRWRDSGGFEEWLELEFFRLHNQIRDENAEVAYKVIARLKERTMVRRIEAEHKLKGPAQIIIRIDPGLEGPPKEAEP